MGGRGLRCPRHPAGRAGAGARAALALLGLLALGPLAAAGRAQEETGPQETGQELAQRDPGGAVVLPPPADPGEPAAQDAGRSVIRVEDLPLWVSVLEVAGTGATKVSEERLVEFVRAVGELARLPEGERPVPDPPLELMRRARLVAREQGVRAELRAHLDWQAVLALRDAGRYEDERALLEEALDDYSADNPYLFSLLLERADLARHLGAWSAALETLDRARGLLPDEPQDRDQLAALADWTGLEGSVYLELGVPDVAEPLFEREAQLAAELDDPAAWWAATLHRLALRLGQEDWEGVQELAREARRHELFQRLPPVSRAQLEVRRGLAAAERARTGRGDAAEAEGEVYTALGREGIAPEDARLAALLLAELRLDRGDHEGARALLAERRALAPERADAQLAALEARLAVEDPTSELPLPEAYERALAAYDAFLGEWSRTPARAGGVAWLRYGERHQLVGELVRLALLVHGSKTGPAKALELVLRAQAQSPLARRLEVEVPTVVQVQRALCSGERGALVYLPGRDRSHVFALDAEGVLEAELPAAWRLDGERRELVGALQARLRDGPGADDAVRGELARAVDALSRELFPPAVRLRMDRWSDLSVVGLEALGYLPFELLSHDGGQPLGLRYALGYQPSLPVGLALVERRPARTPVATRRRGLKDVWLFAAPTPPVGAAPEEPGQPAPPPELAGLPPLPFDEETADRLLAAYEEGRSVRHLGAELTLEHLSDPRVSRAAVLHLFTHGVLDPARERPVGLLLAGGRVLWADDVSGLAFPPLVVLTASGSTRGPLRPGDDGRASLGGAFFEAGARAIVSSWTDLDPTTTLDLAQGFHDALAGEGASPAAALLAARRRALETHGDAAWPEVALVHATGDVFEPYVEPADAHEPWRKAAIVLGAILVSTILLFLVGRRPPDEA